MPRKHHPLPSPPCVRRRLLGNSYRPPDTHGHLETVTALLLTVWLSLLSTNVGAPTAPFRGYPGPNHAAFRPPTVPPGQLFSLSTSVPRSTTTFPPSPTATNPRFIAPEPAPYLPPIQTTSGPSAFPRQYNHGRPSQPRFTGACAPMRLHRRLHIHLGSSVRRTLPQCFFLLAVSVLLFQLLTFFSVSSDHRTVLIQPNGSESPSAPEGTSAMPIPPPPFASTNL